MQDYRSTMQLPPLFFPSPTSSSQQQPPKPHLEEFTLFPLLPPELRIKIWSFCLPGPKLHTVSLPTCSCTDQICPRQHAPRTLSALPILLQVNSEARTECLRRYTILSSRSGRGFKIAWDGTGDSVYFCNGRGPENDFWSVEGRWPGFVEGNGDDVNEKPGIRHLVIDEATLERGDYLKSPERVMGMESVTILLMPWSSRPGSGGSLVGRFELGEDEDENERGWGLQRLRKEFLEWMEEMEIQFGLERKPVLKVAQWEACGPGGADEEGFGWGGGQWRLVETGLWVHWEYNGRRGGGRK